MTAPPAIARRRGQPLAALVAVLAGWIVLRALALLPAPSLPERPVVEVATTPNEAKLVAAPRPANGKAAVAGIAPAVSVARRRARSAPLPSPVLGASERPFATMAAALPIAVAGTSARIPPDLAGPVASSGQVRVPAPTRSVAVRRRSRWSGDGWVFYRRGSGDPAAAAGLFPTYGASQAGGVVRYALAPGSSRAPQAYLRVSRALDVAQSEAAAGLSLRPLPGVPVRVLGEARLQRDAGQTRLRPAASVISELPPVRLPLTAQGELYAQAGYVAGKQATPFFDAQATVERALLAAGPAELSVGAGAWAGGQKGSARLDLGPRASLRVGLGEVSSRLAFDWRFRVAGNARPGSGPAVTFSAGF